MMIFSEDVLINDVMLFSGAIVGMLILSIITNLTKKKIDKKSSSNMKNLNELLKDNK